MVNVDGSKRIWKQPEIKDIFEKCGAKKPDKATWGDVQYVFAMYYSDGFPKVFKCENELVKATLMYLDDPDAPEGVAFIRWLAVQDYLGEKNKLEGSDLRSRSRSFRWCGSHSKKYDSRIPVFPVWKKRIKILYRSAGNRIPVAGLFHITFFDMNIAHESKSNKTPLYLIGELIGVPNTVMDSALHELKDRIDKDPKYKDVKNWLESLPKI